MKLTYALLSGIVIPIAAAVLKRNYALRPREWELVFAIVLLSALALAAAAWIESTVNLYETSAESWIAWLIQGALFFSGAIGIVFGVLEAWTLFNVPEDPPDTV